MGDYNLVAEAVIENENIVVRESTIAEANLIFKRKLATNTRNIAVRIAGANEDYNLKASFGWTPREIVTALWLDGADPSTIINSGLAVSTWIDKSGNSRNVTQGVGAAQPKTGANINGVNALDFDGGDELDCLFGATLAQPNNIFCVHSYDSGFYFVGNAPGGSGMNGLLANSGKYSMFAGALLDATTSTSTGGHIQMSLFNTTSSQIWIDGALENTGNAGAQSMNSIGIGGRAGTLRANCRIGEVLIINGTLSTENRQKIEGYLAHKWALTWNLPAGHPYKTDGSIFGY